MHCSVAEMVLKLRQEMVVKCSRHLPRRMFAYCCLNTKNTWRQNKHEQRERKFILCGVIWIDSVTIDYIKWNFLIEKQHRSFLTGCTVILYTVSVCVCVLLFVIGINCISNIIWNTRKLIITPRITFARMNARAHSNSTQHKA